MAAARASTNVRIHAARTLAAIWITYARSYAAAVEMTDAAM